MDRLTLLETLKSKSMTLSLEDIQGIMDEELNKNPEEMDAELIDLCANVLDNAYFGIQDEVITLENNSEEIQDNTKTHAKRIKFSKVFLIAAVFIIITSIAIPVSARYIHNETSDKIVQFFSDHFKMDLSEGNQNANYHSNDNVNLISELENAGFDKIILPAAFLNDNYSKEDIRITEDDFNLSADIDFKLDNNITGYIGITKYKSDDIGEMLAGQGEIGKQYDSAKQITINGMDVLIFSSSEGDLIAHIKNFYDYSLSPNCPFIPEWKRQGEDYYREKMESLRFGRDTLLPFLMQHTELTPEDEKLLAEIMATEADWNRKTEDKAQPEETKAAEEIPIEETPAEQAPAEESSAVDEMLAYAEKIAAQYETEPPEERFEVIMTSDAFPYPEDAFAIWDNIRDEYYADDYGKVLTYPTEEEAEAGLLKVQKAVADKETEEWLYAERVKQGVISAPSEPAKQDNFDLIGREITIDNRRYLIESIGEISGDVSMRDITFQNNVGFPINRVEKIGYVRRLLEQAGKEIPPEEKTAAPAKPPVPAYSDNRHNYHITDDALGIGGAKEKFRNNMAAVNLLHELQLENRLATPEEQEILAKYVGWGGLSMAFDENNAAWAEEFKELYASLSPEEYRAAKESTLTAFYTPPVVIKAMYEALDRLGFSQGSILEIILQRLIQGYEKLKGTPLQGMLAFAG